MCATSRRPDSLIHLDVATALDGECCLVSSPLSALLSYRLFFSSLLPCPLPVLHVTIPRSAILPPDPPYREHCSSALPRTRLDRAPALPARLPTRPFAT